VLFQGNTFPTTEACIKNEKMTVKMSHILLPFSWYIFRSERDVNVYS